MTYLQNIVFWKSVSFSDLLGKQQNLGKIFIWKFVHSIAVIC